MTKRTIKTIERISGYRIFQSLFLTQSAIHKPEDKIKPPTQTPDTVSSIPIHREIPNPIPTVTVHTGQTAWTGVGKANIAKRLNKDKS
ncbi:hypothetical protein COT65_02245, partial [Candidatus Shapirobacteria bacterium CG09_land_8_20_14_0_10_47_13]